MEECPMASLFAFLEQYNKQAFQKNRSDSAPLHRTFNILRKSRHKQRKQRCRMTKGVRIQRLDPI